MIARSPDQQQHGPASVDRTSAPMISESAPARELLARLPSEDCLFHRVPNAGEQRSLRAREHRV